MWSRWRQYFEDNTRRPLPTIDASGISQAWRGPLVRSLAIFQVGEGGEGRIVHEIERSRVGGIDDDYRASLKLFVKEEGRHARILAIMVRTLGGSLRRSAWADRLFVRGRRLLGLRLKLLVLLVAEVIGLGFYGMIAERLGACPMGHALREIAADEAAHLEFHCAFFRGQTTSPGRRMLFSATWFAVAAAACTVVLVDHRATLKALAIEGAPRRLWSWVETVHRRVCAAEAEAPWLPPLPPSLRDMC